MKINHKNSSNSFKSAISLRVPVKVGETAEESKAKALQYAQAHAKNFIASRLSLAVPFPHDRFHFLIVDGLERNAIEPLVKAYNRVISVSKQHYIESKLHRIMTRIYHQRQTQKLQYTT